jgi:gliding motility-associated lipoprotein GldB
MHKNSVKKIVLLGFLFLFFSCGGDKERKFDVDLSDIKQKEITVKRYEQALFGMDSENIKNEIQPIAKEFPVFLQGDLDDSLNIMQLRNFITDPSIQKLHEDCEKKYPDLKKIEEDLTQAFRYFSYYFPDDPIPTVYSYVSGGDIEHPVKYFDNNLIIALDMYLGKSYPMYSMWGIPVFIRYKMTQERIVPDCMKAIAVAKITKKKSGKALLDDMIDNGKIYYFVELMMPELEDSINFSYTPPQTDWIQYNEGNVWGFFVDKNLLYSTDSKNFNRFLNDGPFTSAFSKESPPRIGHWIGWKIIKKYMNENRQISLEEMLAQDNAQAILNKSKYKPEKKK